MNYEVAVLGAGPIGLAFLCALSSVKFYTNKHKRFVLIDQMKAFPTTSQEAIINQRVLAVSEQTKNLLHSVGAWDYLQRDRIQNYTQMHVWESNGTGHLTFEDESLGHIVEYDNLMQALHRCLLEKGMTEIYYPESVKHIEWSPEEYVQVQTQSSQFTTKLVVGSDGTRSKVKELSKIGTYGWSYNQTGIVCTVQSTSQSQTAYQRFLKNGLPLALLPLRNGMFSIVWSVQNDDFSHLMSLNDAEFLSEINHALQSGRSSSTIHPPLITNLCNKRLSFPLQTLQSNRYVGNRVALIGDAAHSIHPLAGQGMNIGMNDAAFLANCVIKNLRAGCDIGSPQALDEYESQAKLMNYTTSLGMEGVKKLYESTNIELINIIRNLGAQLIQSSPTIKSLLKRQAAQHYLGPRHFEWS